MHTETVMTISYEGGMYYGVPPAVAGKQFTFGGVIRIDGPMVGHITSTVSGDSKLGHKGLSTAAIWKASGAGKRTVSCELSPHEPAPTATQPADQPTGVASNPPIASDTMRAYRTSSLVVTVPCQNASPLATPLSYWCAK